MKLKKVLSIILSSAMIVSVAPVESFAADLDVAVEEFSDDVDEAVVSKLEEMEVEEDASNQATEIEFQEEGADVQQTEDQEISDDDVVLFSDGEDSSVSPGDDSQGITASGQVNENISWTLYDDGKLVIDGNGAIPWYSEDKLAQWSKYRGKIEYIVVENGVTAIGNYAFYGCYNAKNVQIADSDNSIERYAFGECGSLLSVIIPDSVTDIGWEAFKNCSSLTSVEISKNVTEIGISAFEGCNSLSSVVIPDSVTDIGWSAFKNCSSLTNIEISKNVTKIGNALFEGCSSLTNVTLSDNVTTIESYAFENCNSLEKIVLPSSVISIGEYAFFGCNFTSVEIPEGIVNIEKNAFGGKTYSLVGITVPKSIKSFSDQAILVVRYAGTEDEWNKIYKGNNPNYIMHFNYIYDPNHEHEYYKCITKYASCKNDGEYAWICGFCGKIEKTEVIYGGHSWYETERIDATCTQSGKVVYSCDMCSSGRKEEILPALGHKEIKDAAVAATCEKDGLTEGSHCSVCNKVLTEQKKVPATGHEFGVWKTISQATVFSPEQQLRFCSVCGKSENREVGNKLQRTMTVTATSLPLKVKQKTTVLKVSDLAVGDSIVSWKSNNTKVAKVSGRTNGTSTITAGNKKGTAKITITLKSGLQKVVRVTVQKSAVKTKKITGVARNLKLKRKQKAVLRPMIAPLTSTQKVTYKSSNSKVASVNSKGQITAKKKGTAVITVKSGSKTVKCKVSVK